MQTLRQFAFASLCASISTVAVQAEPRVVASIKPVHALVAGVMAGIGEPDILVDGAASPHAYSLKPSQARALQSADVIFWVGHELEAFLEKPLETLGADARLVELADADGLLKLALREGGSFDAHEHENGHDEDHAGSPGEHDHEANHEETNLHIWLHPENARTMISVIESTLADTDRQNADRYSANADELRARIDALTAEIEATLAPVKERRFVVFHDAYPYFENRFGVSAVGSITVNPDSIPGAERIREIQARVRALGVTCVFTEPQFEPKLVSVVMEGTDAKSAVLDPLGASIENGPELYFTLMRNMAAAMRGCLSGGG
jgi:zinc transport system substrate-binding protein